MTHKLNTHTLMKPPTSNPQGVPPTILQHLYTKGTSQPPPPTPNPQGLTPTNLQLLHINGPPYPHPLLPTQRDYDP